METSIIISGFGGQGALFAGQVLAYAVLDQGLEVTWIPSYGPEMRGGTAHCTVVVADEPIGSPLVRNPDSVIAMNLPSFDKYEPLVKSGGLLLADSELVPRQLARTDLHGVFMPAHGIALRHGDQRLVNIAMLGALVALMDLMPLPALETALRRHLPARHHHLLEANVRALFEGASFAHSH
jgi:2-oxoglutarate ferredoxin oxidoreductase subunit gamma